MQLVELETITLERFLAPKCRPVGDDKVVAFLSDVSREILNSQACREYPDVITFGYFCRKGSVKRILQERQSDFQRFGWGLALHIAPSNVPVNFAFSFVFGLLSGNNNLVRLPSSTWPQVELLLHVFDKVSKSEKYRELASNNAFVRTERSSAVLQEFVAHCDALIVWGSNTTVATFRQFNKKPRCVELYFPDRVSSLVINATELILIQESELEKLSIDFFNDTYLMDNNACSSPRWVFWVGNDSDVQKAKRVFWRSVNEFIKSKKYNLDIIAKIDKYLDIMNAVETIKTPMVVEKISEDIWLTPADQAVVAGRFGRFTESIFSHLDLALKALDNEQTLTYIGFDKESIGQAVLLSGALVDRIVPVGAALDIGIVWDGVDTLQRLSRIVDIR